MYNHQVNLWEETLLLSIRNGRNNHAKCLIQNITDAQKLINSSGATLLHYAAEYGNGGLTKYLIDLGSHVDAQNSRGQTPLMLAIAEERVTSIRVLLEYNANIHITDENGRSALQMVVQGSLISQITIQTFLNKLKEETSSDSRLLAQTLRDIDCPLRIAVFLNDAEVTRSILNGGNCEVNDPDPDMGETALHVAVRQLSLENVKLLIEYGANLNVQTFAEHTPLYQLDLNCEDRSLEILKILLDRGAMMFTEVGGVKRCQISGILECGSKKAINLLMQYDVDLCAVDANGSTVLHYLARNVNADVFDELQGRKFDVNARNGALYTPLHLVSGNLSSLKFLMNNGADVNACRNGVTPFTKIFREALTNEKDAEMYESVKLFLQHGANPQFASPDGITIFDRALNDNSYFGLIPVLLHLVLLEDTGTPITELIRSKIYKNTYLREYYFAHKNQLDNLKTMVVWQSITAYKLLTVSEKQLAMYMRQRDQFVPEILNENPFLPDFRDLLHERLDKAILTAELWENSTSTFCDLLKLPYEKYYYVIEVMVISYLSEQDMRNLYSLNEKVKCV